LDVAVYGGSFNPPHIGHAMVAAWLLWTGRVDAVWLVPAFAHAFDKELRPFALRIAMAESMATEVDCRIRVCDIERALPVPSYTIQTLRALRERHPEHRFRLVVGADVLPQTHLWRDWAGIEAEFPPIVVGRGGYPPLPDAPTFPEVSSTAIRALLAAGVGVDHLVTAGVGALLGSYGPAGLGGHSGG
jgi:nicotinate-nucleotide adenylyltransferase